MKPLGFGSSRGTVRSRIANSLPVATAFFLLSGMTWAQAPVFQASSTPTLVVASGGSEVLGTIALIAASTCGTNADGQCLSSPSVINILYVGVPIDNSVATGITVSETIGGATRTAPNTGSLITGAVTVINTPKGGLLSIGIKGGVDLAANDLLIVSGVRGQIISSPASMPGTEINAQFSVSGSSAAFFLRTTVSVGTSAVGLTFVSLVPGPGNGSHPTITVQEGFTSAFAQYVATAMIGPPANPRPAFGALNNTQLHFTATGLAGRLQWPPVVFSQIAGGGGVAGGGSELQLISQSFDGSQATYQFATADQVFSDQMLEIFAIKPTVCGIGTVSVQVQLFPGLGGRPGFNDPLVPSPAGTFVGSSTCAPSPLVVVSGNDQIGVVGMALPQPLVVKVQDANGNPVPGVSINFAAATGGGNLSAASTVTNAQGIGQAVATLGSNPGTDTFIATADSLSATFYATAVPTQVPPFPATNVVPHVVKGGGFLTKITIVNLGKQANPVQVNFLTQGGQLLSSEAHTIPPTGRIDISTSEADRFGELVVQWAVIGSSSPVGVSVFFEVKVPDTSEPATAVSFAAAPVLQSLTLPFAFAPAPAGQTSPQTSGLAVANFSVNSSSVALTLVDATGVAQAVDQMPLLPFGQTAFVLSERPAFQTVLQGRQQFAGSVVVSASTPIAVLDVGNESGRFFAVPGFRPAGCFPSPFSPSQMTFVPHVAAGGGWATRISITNLCVVTDALQIDVFDQTGIPAPNVFGPNATLVPLATAGFSTPDAQRFAPLAVRWARITSNAGIGVQAILDFRSASTGALITALGASQSPSLMQFTLPVDFEPTSAGQSLNVGLALANVASSVDDLVLQLVDSQGTVVAKDMNISLPPLGQTAIVVSDLPAFKVFLSSQPAFSGTLQVFATQPTAAIGVGFDSSIAFTLPIFDASGGEQ